jgi:hypothetical protein
MNEENLPEKVEAEALPAVYEDRMSIQELKAQVGFIHELMKEVMSDGTHYGTIPGCGPKPTLLKPGAELIITTFRCSVDYDETVTPFSSGHVEYAYKCKILSREGTFLGAGTGSCSTMENKYRFVHDEPEPTDRPIPNNYWQLRKSTNEAHKQQATDLIGKDHIVKKDKSDGQWKVFKKGKKIENPNPADFYNTCRKMGKKRALSDAVLTVFSASEIFTQDIEDMYGTGDPSMKEDSKKDESSVDERKALEKRCAKWYGTTGLVADRENPTDEERDRFDDIWKTYCLDTSGKKNMDELTKSDLEGLEDKNGFLDYVQEYMANKGGIPGHKSVEEALEPPPIESME